jgi:hypothetical protein
VTLRSCAKRSGPVYIDTQWFCFHTTIINNLICICRPRSSIMPLLFALQHAAPTLTAASSDLPCFLLLNQPGPKFRNRLVLHRPLNRNLSAVGCICTSYVSRCPHRLFWRGRRRCRLASCYCIYALVSNVSFIMPTKWALCTGTWTDSVPWHIEQSTGCVCRRF